MALGFPDAIHRDVQPGGLVLGLLEELDDVVFKSHAVLGVEIRASEMLDMSSAT